MRTSRLRRSPGCRCRSGALPLVVVAPATPELPSGRKAVARSAATTQGLSHRTAAGPTSRRVVRHRATPCATLRSRSGPRPRSHVLADDGSLSRGRPDLTTITAPKDVTRSPWHSELEVEKPRVLFEGGYEPVFSLMPGERFVMIRNVTEEFTPTEVHVVLSCIDELQRAVK
jgi:hypothetical protein